MRQRNYQSPVKEGLVTKRQIGIRRQCFSHTIEPTSKQKGETHAHPRVEWTKSQYAWDP